MLDIVSNHLDSGLQFRSCSKEKVLIFSKFRAEGQKQVGKVIHPSDCEINFLVPPDPILVKEASKFRLDASKPGFF